VVLFGTGEFLAVTQDDGLFAVDHFDASISTLAPSSLTGKKADFLILRVPA
jgi:hypothetical protein